MKSNKRKTTKEDKELYKEFAKLGKKSKTVKIVKKSS